MKTTLRRSIAVLATLLTVATGCSLTGGMVYLNGLIPSEKAKQEAEGHG